MRRSAHRIFRRTKGLGSPELCVPQDRDDEVDGRQTSRGVEERLKLRLTLRLALAADDCRNEHCSGEKELDADFGVVGFVIECVTDSDEENSRDELNNRRPHHGGERVIRFLLHPREENAHQDSHSGEVNEDEGFFDEFHLSAFRVGADARCQHTLTTMAITYAFVGTGSMGGAILDGLLSSGAGVQVRATTRGSSTVRDGVDSQSTETNPSANSWAVDGADVVVIGVKPAMVTDVLREIADALSPDALIVSVAAGVTTKTMESVVSNPVVRAMPNTPCLVGKGVTGVSAGSRSTSDHLALARTLFEAVGWVLELPEDRIDALSTISGSGPAYVYHAMEKWSRAAVGLGFSESDARNLVEKTFAGSTALLESTGVDPAELRRRVTSPNGTTERAIAVLDAAQLDEVFEAAARAALARAKELAAQLTT